MSKKAQEIKTSVGCPEGQVPTLKRTNVYSNNLQIIFLSILLTIIVIYFIYIRFFAVNVTDTLFMRYKEFFTRAYGNITITFVIGLLAWSLVSEFVTDIIQPLVQASVPDYIGWYEPIVLKTYNQTSSDGSPETIKVLMNPGPFLITFMSFIISIILVFFIAEIMYKLSEVPFLGIISKYISFLTVFGLVLFFLIWSILDRNSINQVEVCTKVNTINTLSTNTLHNTLHNTLSTNLKSQNNLDNLVTTAATFANQLMNRTTIEPQETRNRQNTIEPIIYNPNVVY